MIRYGRINPRINPRDARGFFRTLRGLSYIKAARAFDFGGFSSASTSINDLSGNGNTITPKTGVFASSDGVADKLIEADCSAEGSGNYYLTGKVRPTGTTEAKVNFNNGAAGETITGLTADVWQDFQSSTVTGVTPNDVAVGFLYNSFTFSAGDWSDIRLINADTGEVVAHWPLIDSNAADLDGYPCLDASGNGYHGTHIGGAGGSQESGILQTAGLEMGTRMLFEQASNPANTQYVKFAKMTAATNATIKCKVYVPPQESGFRVLFSDSTNGGDYIGILDEGSTSTAITNGSGSPGIKVDGSTAWGTTRGDLYDALVDGQVHDIEVTGVDVSIWDTDFAIGMYGGSSANGALLMWDVTVDNTSDGTIDFSVKLHGNGPSDVVDDVGSNNGTLVNSPELFVLAPSDSTPGKDALGNDVTIERPNNLTGNIVFDNRIELTDDASLDGLRALWFAYYHDGVARDIIDLSGGAGTVKVAATATDIAATGLTSPTYAVNGATGATLSTGWNTVVVNFDSFSPTADIYYVATYGKGIGYTDPLDAAEIEKNHNALGPKWGLAKV